MKVGVEQRMEIRAIRQKTGAKYKDLAHQFGCSVPHIANIISGRIGALDPEKPQEPKFEMRPHALPWVTKARLMAGR